MMNENKMEMDIDMNAKVAVSDDAIDSDKDKKESEANAARIAHEEAEAKRKAEWEANQATKKEAARKERERIAAMSDDEILELSLERVETQTERLTRRNMKICVMEHIQNKCFADREFRRLVMDPNKNMVNCFRYITNKAYEYIKEEMKINGIERHGMQGYGDDVPDDLCYQWAEDYFYDANAKEDQDKDDTFVPKKYYGATSSASKKKQPKASKETVPKPVDKVIPITKAGKKNAANDMEQMSLFDGMAM